MAAPDRLDRAESGGTAGPAVFGAGAAITWTYVCFVFLFGARIFGLDIGAAVAGPLFIAGFVAVLLLPRLDFVRRRIASTAMLNAGLALFVSVVTIVIADTAYTVWSNSTQAQLRSGLSEEDRQSDHHVWHGELMPRPYHPTERAFFLYKPNARGSADAYGEFYNPRMLRSPTLVDSVLELRRITYGIGPHGLRDTTSIAAARTFAFGDSFVFGYATDESLIWPRLLSDAIGTHVFNAGVSNTGPAAQVMLLRYLLETHADSMRIERLLWMLFEGNDLENSFARVRPVPEGSAASLLDGTVVQAIASLPGRLRNQSIVRRALSGELTVTARTATRRSDPHREVDGVRLPFPLYHSDRWGYRLFNPADMDRATKPLDYVMSHPNRPRLDATFEEMRELAAAHGFAVTVIVAPSAARLYGADFEGFPALSTAPHFAEYVTGLAGRHGFSALDLVETMRPFAQSELLYYRDDHHWNARGNEVAAQLIQRFLADAPIASR